MGGNVMNGGIAAAFVPQTAPKETGLAVHYTGDPYHTDGNRGVLVMSTTEVPWQTLVKPDWEDVKPQPP
jgi:hypothetical protein